MVNGLKEGSSERLKPDARRKQEFIPSDDESCGYTGRPLTVEFWTRDVDRAGHYPGRREQKASKRM